MTTAPAHTDALTARIRRLEEAARALEPEACERAALRDTAIASSERFLASLATRLAYEETEDRGIGLLASPITARGIPMAEAVELLEEHVVRPGGNPASAGHVAYIPGGGIYHAALGDFLAAVSNKYSGMFFTGPGAVRMENMLVRWVADLLGYPDTAGGYIASGGSIGNLTAITTARDAHALRAADYENAVVYLTSQAHHSIEKALSIAGMREARLRHVAVDEGFRMIPAALEEAIAADRAAGLRPWMVAAAAGATDTGAVDPLDAIADVAERAGCWFHVDAAYGGFFLLTEHGRAQLRGIERSDSAVLDPHKGLFLPYGSGMLVVRDARHLLDAHDGTGHYMQDALRSPAEMSPADVSPELSRHFRALRMWLPLKVLGTEPFRAALDEKLLLARYFRREAQALGFEVGPAPDLSIVTFRWAPEGVPLERANEVNEALVDAIRHDGRVFLSSTRLDGRFTLRMAILAFRTHLATVDQVLEILKEKLEEVR